MTCCCVGLVELVVVMGEIVGRKKMRSRVAVVVLYMVLFDCSVTEFSSQQKLDVIPIY